MALTNKYWKTIDQCLPWYRRNTQVVQVYFESMTYRIMDGEPSYEVCAYTTKINTCAQLLLMICDVGGQIGMFSGMCAITVVEFITLAGLILSYMCCHKALGSDEVDNTLDVKDNANNS
jgi:hypothetical protein